LLIEYFEPQLSEAITRIVTTCEEVHHTQNFRRILEECYQESIESSGTLRAYEYLDQLRAEQLKSLHGPYFENEYHYKLADGRLGYTGVRRVRDGRAPEKWMDTSQRLNQIWMRFWFDMLAQQSNGPTLFWPLPSSEYSEPLPDTPRFLFRAFDRESSGFCSDIIAASDAVPCNSEESKTDIRSLTREQISERLGKHANRVSQRTPSDNLVSWSSSLLFVIQGAIYRSYTVGLEPADVRICALDTTEFPVGQFANGRWLIGSCHNPEDHHRRSSRERQAMHRLHHLRQSSHDNGEYFSQGLLYHGDRPSNLVSLQKLLDCGLAGHLYPELAEHHGKSQWTKRVRTLRSAWKQESETISQEIERALRIANFCFPRLDRFDMAITLLMFKNRMTIDGVDGKCFSSKPLFVSQLT
jgi:hypothetical protein